MAKSRREVERGHFHQIPGIIIVDVNASLGADQLLQDADVPAHGHRDEGVRVSFGPELANSQPQHNFHHLEMSFERGDREGRLPQVVDCARIRLTLVEEIFNGSRLAGEARGGERRLQGVTAPSVTRSCPYELAQRREVASVCGMVDGRVPYGVSGVQLRPRLDELPQSLRCGSRGRERRNEGRERRVNKHV